MSDRRAGYLPGKRDDEKRAANIPYYARIFAWKRVDEGPFMSVRVPLIVKNSQEKVEVRGHTLHRESSGSPGPLLTRSFRLDILRFSRFFLSPLLYPTAAIVSRFLNSKKSFVYPCRYRANLFSRSTEQ